MKRAMCAYLPSWPLQRLWRDRPSLRNKPVAIVTPRGRRGPRVLFASTSALQCGIRPDMPVAEAAAVAPQVLLEEEDPDKDFASLLELAAWAERFTPLVGVDRSIGIQPHTPRPSSLFLDITGCADCFGGEDNLLNRAAVDFTEEGWHVRLAIADTLGAAWALAHFARASCVAAPGETAAAIAPLPIAALRLDDDTQQTLRPLGIDSIGQVLELPRPTLAPRFGPHLLERLDQALGRLPEVIQRHRFDPDVEAVFDFEYPLERLSLLKPVLDRLTQAVEADLKRRNWGARQVECSLYFSTLPPQRLEIGLFRPTQTAEHLNKMLQTHLERVRLEEPVCGMGLRVLWAEPVLGNQQELFEPSPDWARLASLLDQLSNRLGQDAVTRAELIPDPQPEYACRLTPAVGKKGKSSRLAPRTDKNAAGKRRRKLRAAATPSPPASGGLPPRRGERGSEHLSLFRLLETDVSHVHAFALPAVSVQKCATDTMLTRASEDACPTNAVIQLPQRPQPENQPERKKPIPWPLRPVKLWPQPVRVQTLAVAPEGLPACFRWRDEEYSIIRAWGPERIQTGWWRGQEVERDYYIVATQPGPRFWLFRRLNDGLWFLHGSFD